MINNIFKKISIRSQHISPDLVEEVYYAMVKTIMDELRDSKKVVMPDWGEFRIKTRKSWRIMNVNSKQHETIPPTNVIKFSPCAKLKDYIKEKI